jgi:hypothetical protein
VGMLLEPYPRLSILVDLSNYIFYQSHQLYGALYASLRYQCSTLAASGSPGPLRELAPLLLPPPHSLHATPIIVCRLSETVDCSRTADHPRLLGTSRMLGHLCASV